MSDAISSATKNGTKALDGITAMLSSYQEAVKFLLRQESYPGVTAAELEFFKSQFRTSAYTCRLSSCPHTTVGFDSKELLREHETSHTRRIPCTFPDCQYPPFVSVQALRNHTKKYHSPSPGRKSIRRVGTLSKSITLTRTKGKAKLESGIFHKEDAEPGENADDAIIAEELEEVYDAELDDAALDVSGVEADEADESDQAFGARMKTPRPTPTSLEWDYHTPLLNILRYKFVVVGKSKDPYFQLLDGCEATTTTPVRVFLDHPRYGHHLFSQILMYSRAKTRQKSGERLLSLYVSRWKKVAHFGRGFCARCARCATFGVDWELSGWMLR